MSSNKSLSSSRSNTSMFTEKKQEDLDALFEDLLGKDDTSLASTAMSSIMPHVNSSVLRPRQSQPHQSSDYNSEPDAITNKFIFSNSTKKKKTSSELLSHRSPKFDPQELSTTGSSISSVGYGPTQKRRITELRAGCALFFLVGLTFVAMQLSAGVRNDRTELSRLRTGNRKHRNDFVNADNQAIAEDGSQPAVHPELEWEMQRREIERNAKMNRNPIPPKGNPAMAFEMERREMEKRAKDPKYHQHNPKLMNEVKLNLLVNGGNGPVDPLPPAREKRKQSPVEDIPVIPPSFDNFGDLGASPFMKTREIPFLWFVPSSGATTVRDIFGRCLQATLAAEQGSQNAYANDKTVEVFKQNDVSYVNVDTTYIAGIERAKEINLLDSNKAEIIISPYLHPISTLFEPQHRGRVFGMFRHPIIRAVARYEYMKTVNPEIEAMTLVEYASSPKIENNWMTRFLTGKLQGEVTLEHMVMAKDMMKQKILVGLYDKMWASVKRFEEYFKFKYIKNSQVQYECRQEALALNVDGAKSSNLTIKEGDHVWTLMLWQNKFDSKLYTYAQELFEEQSSLFTEGQVPK